MKKAPVIFTGHGSPMNAIGENQARTGWKTIGEKIGKPKAILAVSAHWATKGLLIRTAPDNPQINDMYGFPKELYEVHYTPASDTVLAHRVQESIGATEDNTWGIDHGVWSVLSNMYPDADVPVVMISVDTTASPEAQYETGKKLAAFRNEGYMIVTSGNVVHHLGMVDWSMNKGYEWADRFDETIRDAIFTGDFQTPVNYSAISDFEKAIPSAEHYYPLLTALGAAEIGEPVAVFNEYRELGSMSMTSYVFGEI